MPTFKGDGSDRIIVGYLIKDVEMSTFGHKKHPKARFTVSVSDNRDDPHGLVNVDALFDLANRCAGLRKFDVVLVAGTLESYETKAGARRWFLQAKGVFAMPPVPPASQTATETTTDKPTDGFTDVGDEELPF